MENVMHRERCDSEAASGHPVTSEAQQAELPVSFELLQHGVIGHLCGSTIELSRAAGETEYPSKPTREFGDGPRAWLQRPRSLTSGQQGILCKQSVPPASSAV